MGKSTSPLTYTGMALMGFAGVWYLLAETVAATGFRGYNYATNWISDLGVPEPQTFQGRTIDSQLAVVMNAGFVGQGLLFILGAALIFFANPQARRGTLLLALAVLHGLGICLVGLVNGNQENVAAGLAVYHFGGAMSAIVGGNLAVMVAGASVLRDFLPEWVQRASIGLGAVGLVSLVLLLAVSPSLWTFAPIFERGAVYTVMVGELIFGVIAVRGVRTMADTAA
ncbi:DUF998 domain-containing protein [Yimella sp. cx-51]|nr:DUF998 domain-containing protein [Yimella sp. cx-51]QTH37466.1 DUF998 domain-containing protein [Yimella sp. cx-51]